MARETSSDSTTVPQRLSTEGLVRQLLRARQHASELCIAILEVDYFKRISHKHGELAGDYVLLELIRVVRSRIGRDQVFARFGKQFVITLPHTSLDDAASFAENLRSEVQAHSFTYQDEPQDPAHLDRHKRVEMI
jgi:two-component system, cell cycle response regulator